MYSAMTHCSFIRTPRHFEKRTVFTEEAAGKDCNRLWLRRRELRHVSSL